MKHTTIYFFTLLICQTSLAFGYDTADKLHTLFTSPGIRIQLDEIRNSGAFNKTTAENTHFNLQQKVNVNMQGIVIRKNQPPIIFVNDNNTLNSPVISNDILIHTNNMSSSSITIPLKARQKSLKLKPGQQWNESEGKTNESFQVNTNKPDSNSVLKNITSKIMK